MPIQQICTIDSMEQLDASTWWMVLEAGKLVEQHGLTGGQFLHIKCGEGQLLRRPISVAYAGWDEPEDLVTLIFEVRGEGTKWLSQRKKGDKLDVLGPLGNTFDVSREGRYLLVGGSTGNACNGPGRRCWASAPRTRPSPRWSAASKTTARALTSVPTTAAWAVTASWTVRCGISLQRITALQPFLPAAPNPC